MPPSAVLLREVQRRESAQRWARLVEHVDGLRRSLVSTVGSHEAEDVAQEAVLRASLSTSAVPPGAQGAAWLRRIARNIAIDRWRHDRRLVPLDIAAHITAESESSAGRIDVEVALAHLRPDDRRLLALIASGVRYRELAHAERVDVSVIRQRVARARARVLAALREDT
jgi:RNA polymerase sigma-70 factor (ECF subfamily)